MSLTKGGLGLPDDLAERFETDYVSQLDDAREIAMELIETYGATHTGEVLKEMEQRGIALPPKQHWAGSIFRSNSFKWTGHWTKGRGHDQLARLWTRRYDD